MISWYLPNGYVVQFHTVRKHKRVVVPSRFLVLGRKPGPHGIRPLVCAGNVFVDRLEVDHGALDPDLEPHVLRAFAR